MFPAPTLGLLLLGSFLAAPVDRLTIDLTAASASASATTHAEITAPGVKPKARGVLEAKAGAPISVKWTMANGDPKVVLENVMVHFFVVKEEKTGQPTVPKLTKGVLVESALTMDFKPGDKTQGDLSFVIAKPGSYLLRLETIGGAAGVDGHEHYAALDLVIH